MPVPKRKRSRARKSKRNANKGLKVKAFTSCKNCTEPLMSHAACSKCGFYKGVKVFTSKEERSARRSTEKKAKADNVQAKQAKQEAIKAEAEKKAD